MADLETLLELHGAALFVCLSCVVSCYVLSEVRPKTHLQLTYHSDSFRFDFPLVSDSEAGLCWSYCGMLNGAHSGPRGVPQSLLSSPSLSVINFQPDHVNWSEIMTLLNESHQTSLPSFPPSSLDPGLSMFASPSPSPVPTSSSMTSTNCTDSPSASSPPYNFYAVLLVLLIFCVIFGNVLVCVAVSRERALQTTTNYLIVSLAVSDLLLATLVMPWGVYLEVCLCLCAVFIHGASGGSAA